MNYYEILEVTNNASDEVIKASYKALVKKYHPDNVNNLSVSKDISLINEAYEVLSNPIKRKEYDKKIKVDNVKFNDNITLEKSENTEPYSNGKLGKLFKNIGKEIFNIIDQKNSEIQNAYFEKDNDAKTGSKGDFIFRENTEDGVELVSIMFEMKNEADETKTKHKNEDFFKELDKDRREKNCEYAVLVSTLEMENEYYNTGIVDVSYRYPKMYVIRPQLFIPMITLIRNASLNSLQYKREIKVMKEEQLDIFNFQENLEAFKTGFNKNFKDASERFQDAINGIDKTIDQLEKIKKALLTSEKHLNAANNKIEDVTIKKLTKNAPSVRAMLEGKE